MGSGETTTGMLGVHREVFSGLPDPTDARLMDSPFAFQENADELVEKINQYFTESLGHPLRAINLPASADALTLERALADIRAADWVFAGPGSPSYARRCWEGTAVPDALAGVVAPGRSGSLVFASAAVVTLGDWALPVYEIYKVGEDPRWEPGIGLMSQILGWRCAVIPHYDNREGGTHDTRFCYVGGRRLAQIEPDLGDGFILGVDEHTALVLDLDAGTAWVSGRSAVTLRVAGAEDVISNGSRLTIAEIEDRISALGAGAAVGRGSAGSGDGPDPHAVAEGSVGPHVEVSRGAATPDPAADPDSQAGEAADVDASDLARTVLAALPASATHERAAVVALVHQAEAASATHDRELAGRAVQALVDLRSDSRAAGDSGGKRPAARRPRRPRRGGARQPRGVDMAVDVTPGPIALVGSGEYLPVMLEIERHLIEGRPPKYVQIPTAAAPEGPAVLAKWTRLGAEQAERLGVEAVPPVVHDRAEADDPRSPSRCAGPASSTCRAGTRHASPRRCVTPPCGREVLAAWRGGAALAGCSAGAMAMTRWVPHLRALHRPADQGLGLLPHLRVIPHFDKMLGWAPDMVTRVLLHDPDGSPCSASTRTPPWWVGPSSGRSWAGSPCGPSVTGRAWSTGRDRRS